ncbi:MAG: Uma2 family endonuclease [Pyrinomonadaceae bacterium]
MNITVEKTMEMPNAVLFARKLDAALKAEKKKREHFYEIIDENKKMEFINGEIIFQSPVKLQHNSVTIRLVTLLSTYVSKKSLGYVGVEKILISLTRNDYEPDICFFYITKSVNFKPKQMQFPAPDLVAEVLSESTEIHDRETKFQDYAAHGVSEYWIVDPENETAEQYMLRNEEYELVLKAKDGMIESVAVDGFAIPIKAIFNESENLAVMKSLIAD